MSKIIISNLILLFCMIHFAVSTTQDNKWFEFKKTYNKKYASTEEELNHKKIFFDNLREIEEHNKRFKEGKETFERNVSVFTDMNLNEVSQKRTMTLKNDVSFSKIPVKNITLRGPLPRNVNWTERGFNLPIQDQADCGSCYAFATVAAIEAQYFIKNKKKIKLSEQYVVDCSAHFGNHGCGGGYPDSVFDYAKFYGIGLNQDFPNLKRQQYCGRKRGGTIVKISSFNKVPPYDEEELKKVVATIGPVVVGIDADGNQFFEYKGDKVYYNPRCRSHAINHAVLVVGYGTTPKGEDYWLIRNSFGKYWGNNGYMKLARNRFNHCGITTLALYPMNPRLMWY